MKLFGLGGKSDKKKLEQEQKKPAEDKLRKE